MLITILCTRAGGGGKVNWQHYAISVVEGHFCNAFVCCISLCSADTRRTGFTKCEYHKAANRGSTAQRVSGLRAAANEAAVGPT